MATTDRAAELHEPLCRELMRDYVLLTQDMDMMERIENLIVTGCIDASRLYEIVSSLKHNIPLDSVEGRDLADGSNCKLTARYGPVNGQRTAYGWIIKVTNCTGDVRAILHNPGDGKTYEAYIPFEEHQNQRYITITDCKRGEKFGRWTKYIREIGQGG
jgi:hypothetical protein